MVRGRHPALASVQSSSLSLPLERRFAYRPESDDDDDDDDDDAEAAAAAAAAAGDDDDDADDDNEDAEVLAES